MISNGLLFLVKDGLMFKNNSLAAIKLIYSLREVSFKTGYEFFLTILTVIYFIVFYKAFNNLNPFIWGFIFIGYFFLVSFFSSLYNGIKYTKFNKISFYYILLNIFFVTVVIFFCYYCNKFDLIYILPWILIFSGTYIPFIMQLKENE